MRLYIKFNFSNHSYNMTFHCDNFDAEEQSRASLKSWLKSNKNRIIDFSIDGKLAAEGQFHRTLDLITKELLK